MRKVIRGKHPIWAYAKFTSDPFTAPAFSNSSWRVCVSRTQPQSYGGVSLLLRIGNRAKRERALTSAYKLLVDISSVTSLPAMCRLVSAVWWMVPPAPPISLLSSRPSRRALPQIVAHTVHNVHKRKPRHPHAPHALCIRDSLRKRANNRTARHERDSRLFSPLYPARNTIFSRDIQRHASTDDYLVPQKKQKSTFRYRSTLAFNSIPPVQSVINNGSMMANDIVSYRLPSSCRSYVR